MWYINEKTREKDRKKEGGREREVKGNREREGTRGIGKEKEKE